VGYPCEHKTVSDHAVRHPTKGHLVWRCSVCGKASRWGPTWTYYGNVECRICWEAQVDNVYCSEPCRSARA